MTKLNRIVPLGLLLAGILLPCLLCAGPRERNVLVIPVEFKDITFTYSTDNLEAFLNERDFSFEGATGSVSRYFGDQFGDSLALRFQMTPTVSLSRERAYYGEDNAFGEDSRPDEMVREACTSLDEVLDFSVFDNDSTGFVQHLLFIYAGEDEALGGPAECLWSQCWSLKDLGQKLRLDNTTINIFACTSELGDDGKLSGIGRFCHETLHTMGLPDFYDSYIPAEKAYYSAALWGFTSIMDGGWRNNGGRTPPCLNAVERFILGTGSRSELKSGANHLSPIVESGAYAAIDCPQEGECFLFECRSQNGWDRFIGGSGMLVYHLDKTGNDIGEYKGRKLSARGLWDYNLVNIFPGHQCVDLVEASGKEDRIFRNRTISEEDLPDIFFPVGGTALGPYTNPALKSWYSGGLGLTVNLVTAGPSGGINLVLGEETTVIDRIEIFQDAAIVNWTCKQEGNCSIQLDSNDASIVAPAEGSSFSFLFENLAPGASYTVTITDSEGYIIKQTFTTRSWDKKSRPRILTDSFPKDSQGFVKAGSRIPLRIENAPGEKIRWYADGTPIVPEADGKVTIERSVVLKARIYRMDNAAITIVKELKVK